MCPGVLRRSFHALGAQVDVFGRKDSSTYDCAGHVQHVRIAASNIDTKTCARSSGSGLSISP